jgi:hypothetical protein
MPVQLSQAIKTRVEPEPEADPIEQVIVMSHVFN